VVPVAAPVRVRERLAAAQDGPRTVVHASSSAIYADLDGWCLGLVSASATRVPCALWSRVADLTLLGPPVVRVEDGELHVGDHRVVITRLADVSAPTVRPRAGSLGPLVAPVLGTALPADGRLTSAHLDQLLGRGPGLTPVGDDLLAGWFVTRMAAGRPDLPLAAALRRRLGIRLGVTTLLSATLLDCAMRGETLPQLADWLADPVPATTEALLAVGATSGAGLLAGAGLALSSLATDRPGRAA
jgi:Protein of unknown function (DUF2877)